MERSSTDTEASRRRAVEEQLAAFNAHDAAGYAAFYADDAVLHDPEYPGPLRGREAVRRDMAKFLTAFPHVTGELHHVLVDGRTTAVEMTMTGENTGPVGTLDGGQLPPTGRVLRLPLAVFSRFDDSDRIVEERRYFDVAGLFRQLGMA